MLRLKYLAILAIIAQICLSTVTAQIPARNANDNQVCRKEEAPNTSKTDLYYQLSMEFRHKDPVKGMDYASKAISLAKASNDYETLAKSYLSLGINERFLDMNMNTIQHFSKALQIARDHDLKRLEAQASNSIARIMLQEGRMDSVDIYISEALNIANSTNDLSSLSYAYINMGLLQYKEGNLDSAIALLNKSYIIRHDSIGMSSDYLVPLCHLSEIYEVKQEYTKAKNCLYMALSNNGYSQLSSFLASIWLKLGQIYYHTDMLDSAEAATQKAADNALESRSFQKLEDSYKLLDSIYTTCGQYEKAAIACDRFSSIADTFYNSLLGDNLRIIQHSFNYLENEESLQESKDHRSILLWVLVCVALALAIAIPYTVSLIINNRKIHKLYDDINIKLQSKFIDLYVTHNLQMALQPMPDEFGDVFRDNFLIYMPREIISGDFFWNHSDSRYEIITVADCTGHGMPGAMLTMLGITTLHDIVTSGERRADAILEKLRSKIIQLMSTNALNKMEDGMDISLMVIDRQTNQIDFAGAYNSLYYIRDGEMNSLPASRCPIGDYIVMKPFTSHKLQMKPGDTIYLMSDGYWSQFGGPNKEKISKQNFFDILLDIHGKSMQEQEEYLKQYFCDWKGSNEQIDDVTLAGFRI